MSPVALIFIPSLLAVRTSDLELLADMEGVGVGVVGVEGVVDTDCFRVTDTCREQWFTDIQLISPHDRCRWHAPEGFSPAEDDAAALLCCFSISTICFHFLTISFARSATFFDVCERSLPTASPALLSYGLGNESDRHSRYDAIRTLSIGSDIFDCDFSV